MQTICEQILTDTLYYRQIPVLTYRIAYPAFTTTCNPAAAQRINEMYAAEAKEAQAYCRTALFADAAEQVRYFPAASSFPSYQWLLSYTVTLNQGCVTSLFLEQYSYTGGAHGNTVRTSDTWDFKTGARFSLSDFPETLSPDIRFQDAGLLNLSWRSHLFQAIEGQIQNRLSETPGSFFDEYPALLRQTFRPDSFYLVPAGIVFYYQPYDIAPYAAGIPEFFFSLPELSLPEPQAGFYGHRL
ncbi:MAG: DUF3298 and DUF4163 domain-containing protein [Lachnospiraceae bacterium]|nr:DUF3298 and DUF4163 domain-containing protein [Lachnospiraceae bacterium]